MDKSYHYLLMANQALIHKKLLAILTEKNTGLTLGQPKILDYLKDHDGVNQKKIADSCHIEPASLTSVLNRMEDKGLIERRTLNGNRRTYHIFMTDEGKRLQKQVSKAFIQLEEETFKGISPEEREHFMDIFSKIYMNMSYKPE